MTREDVLAILKAHEAELRHQGVAHAGLFGSLARGDSGPDSDIDVMIRFDPEAPITLWTYVRLKREIAALFAAAAKPVDVIDLDGMRSHARPSAERDAIYAF